MMEKMTVRDINVEGKRVLVRVDFNVPLDEKTGAITDDTRIRASLPTINYLLERKTRVILMSHLGRPKGKYVKSLSLAPVASRLSEILGKPVKMANDCVGPEVERLTTSLKEGDVLLLENLRFHPEEEAGDSDFAAALARLADIYVDDAFGTAHRPHASVSGITKYLPSVAGFLLEKEVDTLGGILKNPARPFAALLGGAKVSDKVGMLENILNKVDTVLIGGGMAATFFKAKSLEIGTSLVELDRVDFANHLMENARRSGVKILLPVDVVIAGELSNDAKTETVPADRIPSDRKIVDIGPQTIKLFTGELNRCKTIFWNGPMGIYEIPCFAGGTRRIAKALAGLKATTVIGGGSTAEAVTEFKLDMKMSFVSTGGGASLEFLSGEILPGVAALMDKVPPREASH